jgi:hypothetical protein
MCCAKSEAALDSASLQQDNSPLSGFCLDANSSTLALTSHFAQWRGQFRAKNLKQPRRNAVRENVRENSKNNLRQFGVVEQRDSSL